MLAGIMRYLTILLFFLFSCGESTNKQNISEQPTTFAPNLKNESTRCDSIGEEGLTEYQTFDEFLQSSKPINFYDLTAEQRKLVERGLCQLKQRIENRSLGILLKYPIEGGCLRSLVGIQDYSNTPIELGEIDSLSVRTFDNELTSTINSSSSKSLQITVDDRTGQVNSIRFTVIETYEDEFGEGRFDRWYIFRRFKEGFLLNGVACAG